MLRFVCQSGVRFVTTSAGSPAKFVAPLKDAGVVVCHAVPTVEAAVKAASAGVDGLVVIEETVEQFFATSSRMGAMAETRSFGEPERTLAAAE